MQNDSRTSDNWYLCINILLTQMLIVDKLSTHWFHETNTSRWEWKIVVFYVAAMFANMIEVKSDNQNFHLC